MKTKARTRINVDARIRRRKPVGLGTFATTHYALVCRGPDGRVKWREEFHNLVTNEGLNDLLDKYFKGSGYSAAFYVGLTTGAPTFAAADTMASHSGWTEFTNYDEAARQPLTLGTPAAGSVSNGASPAAITCSTNSSTIGGAFLCTNNTKGGSTGTLYGGGAFLSGDKALDDGDSLDITLTLTMYSA